jgi:hypothetical protein
LPSLEQVRAVIASGDRRALLALYDDLLAVSRSGGVTHANASRVVAVLAAVETALATPGPVSLADDNAKRQRPFDERLATAKAALGTVRRP